MAALSEADRLSATIEAMRHGGWDAPITKSDLRAAVDAIDDWIEANSASFNSAIPQPARGQLTTKQKARLLVFIASRRYLVT